MKAGKQTVELVVRGIPPDIRRHFKAKCSAAGLSMNETLIQYMRMVAHGGIELVGPREAKR